MTSPELDNAEPMSVQDPVLLLAGIKQFGLAGDGSDLRDLAAAITRLSSELAASRERERALERVFRLADAIACDAIRWGYFVSDGALQQLADARALSEQEAG